MDLIRKVKLVIFSNKKVLSTLDFLELIKETLSMPLRHLRYGLFGNKIVDPKAIPILINNYNRLSYLKALINSLEIRGYHNIYIIDNNSSFPELLEYYRCCPYKVFRLKENIGYLALWQTDVYKDFISGYYVYTDADMEIDPMCPDDFLSHFLDIFSKEYFAQKVGFGIRIDNLPSYYDNKDRVISWESQYWKNKINDCYFRAPVDTTFALYRPYCKGKAVKTKVMIRTDFPYVIKHLPWYVNSNSPSEEDLYYQNTFIQSTHWTRQNTFKDNK